MQGLLSNLCYSGMGNQTTPPHTTTTKSLLVATGYLLKNTIKKHNFSLCLSFSLQRIYNDILCRKNCHFFHDKKNTQPCPLYILKCQHTILGRVYLTPEWSLKYVEKEDTKKERNMSKKSIG